MKSGKKKIKKDVKKEIVKENVVKEVEEKEDFFDDKKVQKTNEKKKSLGHKIFDIVFWTLFVCIAAIWIIDFIKVENNKEPLFCIKKETHEYEDGTTDECVGLGYNIYYYHRDSINISTQFSPFFIKMKE